MTASCVAVPVSLAPMDGREQLLRSQIDACVEGPELAGLLTELAGLHIAAGRMDEAGGLLQQAYAIRMKELTAGCPGSASGTDAVQQSPQQQPEHHHQQQHPSHQQDCQDPLPQQSEQQPQQQHHQHQLEMLQHQLPGSSSEGTDTAEDISPAGPESSSPQQSVAAEDDEAAAGSSRDPVEQQANEQQQQQQPQESEEDEDWDKSDDWEPDLSLLHTANSFERKKQQQQQQQQPTSSATAGSRSAASKADSADWWRPSSSGGSARASSQPRGRGESKCGAASDADSDSGWDLAGVANQPHILEIFGLTRSVKTSHIEEFLLEFMWGGTTANVKWVDDEHALAVFPCAEAAQVLLDSSQKQFKVRPYNKASGAALQIAAEELTPPRSARPKTTTAVARRLISNALGNREVRDKAAERELASLRKANKMDKQQRQQQLSEAWGDD